MKAQTFSVKNTKKNILGQTKTNKKAKVPVNITTAIRKTLCKCKWALRLAKYKQENTFVWGMSIKSIFRDIASDKKAETTVKKGKHVVFNTAGTHVHKTCHSISFPKKISTWVRTILFCKGKSYPSNTATSQNWFSRRFLAAPGSI